QLLRQAITRPGYPGERDAVDEAAGLPGDRRALRIGARRSEHKDEVQPVPLQRLPQVPALVRRQVRHDDPISPCFSTCCGEPLKTVAEQGVEVSHEVQGHVNALET